MARKLLVLYLIKILVFSLGGAVRTPPVAAAPASHFAFMEIQLGRPASDIPTAEPVTVCLRDQGKADTSDCVIKDSAPFTFSSDVKSLTPSCACYWLTSTDSFAIFSIAGP